MAVIIDGKELARKVRTDLKIECENLKKKGIPFSRPMRFDVVEILGKKIRVIKNAF